jgi:hypothetical protein
MSEDTKPEMYISMTLNKQVLDVLKKYSISIDQLFILLALYDEAIPLLDVYDGDNTSTKILIEQYQPLHIHGFIKYTGSESTRVYELDDAGKALVESVRVLFEEPDGEKQVNAMIRDLGPKYLALWPSMRLPSGVPSRVSIVEIEKRLRSFINTYKAPLKREYGIKLTPELILQATKGYVERYAAQQYMYMVNSAYFIQKREKSSLADEIIALQQGVTTKPATKWEKQL